MHMFCTGACQCLVLVPCQCFVLVHVSVLYWCLVRADCCVPCLKGLVCAGGGRGAELAVESVVKVDACKHMVVRQGTVLTSWKNTHHIALQGGVHKDVEHNLILKVYWIRGCLQLQLLLLLLSCSFLCLLLLTLLPSLLLLLLLLLSSSFLCLLLMTLLAFLLLLLPSVLPPPLLLLELLLPGRACLCSLLRSLGLPAGCPSPP